MDTKSCSTGKIIIIVVAIILVLAVIGVVLYFTVFKKSSSNSDDSYTTTIDTFTQEEMDKARNAFKQFSYTDTANSSYVLNYNLFIPENYNPEKKYPLIMFIHDASIVGASDTKDTLTKTIGGPIWATDREQKKHQCFVLAPLYSEVIIDDNKGYTKSEYIEVTTRLIKNLTGEYSINTDKIYSTGQSMGAMTTLYLLANYPDLLTAGIIVDGQWKIDEIKGVSNATFTYFAAGGDMKAFNGQTEVKQYLASLNITYGELTDLNAQDNITVLNDAAKRMYNKNYKNNFITYKSGTVLPTDSDNAQEHMCSFKYGYRIDVVRDWLFEQNKINCEENTYYSEDGKCANTNFCKVTNEDLSCNECVYGYYLTEDKKSCTQEKNCKRGDKKTGECQEKSNEK